MEQDEDNYEAESIVIEEENRHEAAKWLAKRASNQKIRLDMALLTISWKLGGDH